MTRLKTLTHKAYIFHPNAVSASCCVKSHPSIGICATIRTAIIKFSSKLSWLWNNALKKPKVRFFNSERSIFSLPCSSVPWVPAAVWKGGQWGCDCGLPSQCLDHLLTGFYGDAVGWGGWQLLLLDSIVLFCAIIVACAHFPFADRVLRVKWKERLCDLDFQLVGFF